MGKWNEQWMLGINNMVKLKVPVQAQFKDAQTFATNLDKAEDLNNELLEMKKKAEAIVKEVDTKQKALESMLKAIASKVPEYDKSLVNLVKVMTKDANKDGLNACTALKLGLNRVDGFCKGTLALKFSVEVKNT